MFRLTRLSTFRSVASNTKLVRFQVAIQPAIRPIAQLRFNSSNSNSSNPNPVSTSASTPSSKDSEPNPIKVTFTPAPSQPSSPSQPTQPSSPLKLDKPSYHLSFTCKKCSSRSGHVISKQAYHGGSVVVQCPSCKTRHLIADHLKIFSDDKVTIEDILKKQGQTIQKGTVSAADIEALSKGSNNSSGGDLHSANSSSSSSKLGYNVGSIDDPNIETTVNENGDIEIQRKE